MLETASMIDTSPRQIDLQAAAKQAMIENGFERSFPPRVQQQLTELKAHPPQVAPNANISRPAKFAMVFDR
jgi:hypothetical protein